MKKAFFFFILSTVLFFCSCSGSDTYRGLWKATDSKGNKFDILFNAKNVSLRDMKGETASFDYSQHSVTIQNAIRTYGIQLKDGREYYIHFPIADDKSKAVIQDAGNNPIYTISRENYLDYNDVVQLR